MTSNEMACNVQNNRPKIHEPIYGKLFKGESGPENKNYCFVIFISAFILSFGTGAASVPG